VWWGGEEFGRDKIEGIIGAGPAMGGGGVTARGGGSNLSSTWGPPKLVCARGGCGTALLCGVCVAAAARIRESLVRGAAHFWLCARRRRCHIFGCARAAAAATVVVIFRAFGSL